MVMVLRISCKKSSVGLFFAFFLLQSFVYQLKKKLWKENFLANSGKYLECHCLSFQKDNLMIYNPSQHHQLINVFNFTHEKWQFFLLSHFQMINKLIKDIWSSVSLKYRHSSKWISPPPKGKSFLQGNLSRGILIKETTKSSQ